MSTEPSKSGKSSQSETQAQSVPSSGSASQEELLGHHSSTANLDPDIQPEPGDQAVSEAADGDGDDELANTLIKPENG